MFHHSGPALRTMIGRATTWQRVLLSVALVAAGAVFVALGHLRGGLVAVAGLVMLAAIVRNRFGRDARATRDAVDPTPAPVDADTRRHGKR
jgi:hypothetical protein